MCHRTKGSAAAESWHEILISLDQQNLGNFAMLAAMPRFMAATAISGFLVCHRSQHLGAHTISSMGVIGAAS
jgi:hypothetical protein